MNVLQYINENIDGTVRYNTEDRDGLIGMPYPYSVSGVADRFNEMYYWGTYFTNVGLILTGRISQAKNNVDNMFYLIDRFGFVPNANRTWAQTRSQPPFLSRMVSDIYDETGDKAWLMTAYHKLKKEYTFWQTQRMTKSGLNRYFGADPDLQFCSDDYCRRLHMEKAEDEDTVREYAYSYQSGAESGWDFSSRTGLEAHKYNGVDLNSLLYGFEKNMEKFAQTLHLAESKMWTDAAECRAKRMNALMWDAVLGAFCDYNFETEEKSDLVSQAMFYPLYAGLSTKEQAEKTVQLLPGIEYRYGVSASENRADLLNLQWDYPHGWPCLQMILIKGLVNYGYTEAAKRIAGKYLDVADTVFRETGRLWEKYNVVTGGVSVSKEYTTPPIMGWSAAAYLYCKKIVTE